MMRHIDIEGSYNVRDLGGYPTADGRVTRWRVLVRAGNLDKVTPVGQQQLLTYGIKTIIDLREAGEVKEYPNVFAQSTSMLYLHLPFAREGFINSAGYTLLEEFYSQYLSSCQVNVGAIIAAIIENTPGTLFHCFAGKDRTGIVTALVLGAVGVPDQVIVEDYAQSSQRIAHLISEWRDYALKHQQSMDQFERDVASDPKTMLATLDHLKQHYGGIRNYLQACGVTEQQLARLQSLLVEP